jgi:hypothetical protein
MPLKLRQKTRKRWTRVCSPATSKCTPTQEMATSNWMFRWSVRASDNANFLRAKSNRCPRLLIQLSLQHVTNLQKNRLLSKLKSLLVTAYSITLSLLSDKKSCKALEKLAYSRWLAFTVPPVWSDRLIKPKILTSLASLLTRSWPATQHTKGAWARLW